jgi:hypothetical protein
MSSMSSATTTPCCRRTRITVLEAVELQLQSVQSHMRRLTNVAEMFRILYFAWGALIYRFQAGKKFRMRSESSNLVRALGPWVTPTFEEPGTEEKNGTADHEELKGVSDFEGRYWEWIIDK